MNRSFSRYSSQRAIRRQQSGFTLIEVMVSVLVLSIGLVGVAALQGVSLKNTQSAFMRSQATALAYDLADRMRANVLSARTGLYNPGTAASVAGCKSTTGCTAQDMAKHDLAEWNAAIATYLPMGQGFVCVDSTPDDGASAASAACDGNGTQIAIKIWWDDDRDGTINMTAINTERLAIAVEL
ncbi:MAG: type IV pilus modification protein PilV [Woeseiaceae bacterium]